MDLGKVLSVKDGIVIVSGIPTASIGEILNITSDTGRNILCMVLSLNLNDISAVLLEGNDTNIREGLTVTPTGKLFSIRTGGHLLGHVVDPFGHYLDSPHTLPNICVADVSYQAINTNHNNANKHNNNDKPNKHKQDNIDHNNANKHNNHKWYKNININTDYVHNVLKCWFPWPWNCAKCGRWVFPFNTFCHWCGNKPWDWPWFKRHILNMEPLLQEVWCCNANHDNHDNHNNHDKNSPLVDYIDEKDHDKNFNNANNIDTNNDKPNKSANIDIQKAETNDNIGTTPVNNDNNVNKIFNESQCRCEIIQNHNDIENNLRYNIIKNNIENYCKYFSRYDNNDIMAIDGYVDIVIPIYRAYLEKFNLKFRLNPRESLPEFHMRWYKYQLNYNNVKIRNRALLDYFLKNNKEKVLIESFLRIHIKAFLKTIPEESEKNWVYFLKQFKELIMNTGKKWWEVIFDIYFREDIYYDVNKKSLTYVYDKPLIDKEVEIIKLYDDLHQYKDDTTKTLIKRAKKWSDFLNMNCCNTENKNIENNYFSLIKRLKTAFIPLHKNAADNNAKKKKHASTWTDNTHKNSVNKAKKNGKETKKVKSTPKTSYKQKKGNNLDKQDVILHSELIKKVNTYNEKMIVLDAYITEIRESKIFNIEESIKNKMIEIDAYNKQLKKNIDLYANDNYDVINENLSVNLKKSIDDMYCYINKCFDNKKIWDEAQYNKIYTHFYKIINDIQAKYRKLHEEQMKQYEEQNKHRKPFDDKYNNQEEIKNMKNEFDKFMIDHQDDYINNLHKYFDDLCKLLMKHHTQCEKGVVNKLLKDFTSPKVSPPTYYKSFNEFLVLKPKKVSTPTNDSNTSLAIIFSKGDALEKIKRIQIPEIVEIVGTRDVHGFICIGVPILSLAATFLITRSKKITLPWGKQIIIQWNFKNIFDINTNNTESKVPGIITRILRTVISLNI